MRILTIILVVLLLLPGCKVKKKSSKNIKVLPKQENVVVALVEPEVIEAPIIVKEEIITSVDKNVVLPIEESYFVIMGSFKVLANAKRFQTELTKKGFTSQLLQNEQGLYRVSVNSFNDIEKARTLVFSIRKNYPEHNDVWLLRKSK